MTSTDTSTPGCWTWCRAGRGRPTPTGSKERGDAFRRGVKIAALDPFQGYKRAIDDQLQDAVAVLDAFHVVKLATAAVHECRRRIQQETLGPPRPQRRPALRHLESSYAPGRRSSLTGNGPGSRRRSPPAPEEHLGVYLAWSCAQQLRSAYRHPNTVEGRKIAEKVLDTFPSCPIPEIARLGRTLKRWQRAFLAYFDTSRSNNGGTEAVNGLIELHRRVARGFRNYDNYPPTACC